MLKIDQIVRGRSPELSPAQREVLDFILNHPEHSVLLTATDLARKLNVSDTSIVRFAHALGYSGFSHLKRRWLRKKSSTRPAWGARINDRRHKSLICEEIGNDTFRFPWSKKPRMDFLRPYQRRLREYLQARIPAVDRQGETVERTESVDGVLADVLSKDLKNLKQQVSPFKPLRSLRNRIIYRIIFLCP